MVDWVAKVCGSESGVVNHLVSVRSSSSSESGDRPGGSSSSSSVTNFVDERLRTNMGNEVKTEGDEAVEEGVVVAEVGVNTTARFGVAGVVAGTGGSVGTTRTADY